MQSGLRCVEFDHYIQDKFGPKTSPDDFPDLDIPDTPEHDNFDDVNYAGRDNEWVKCWRAFTGDGLADGLTGDADDELPTPSLGIDGESPMPEAFRMESLRGLRYKLRMMGVGISGPSYIYGDNMSVIHNTQRPESMLKKKTNSICYHAVRKSVAMGESLTAHIGTNENLSDLTTKVLYGQKQQYMVSQLLYDIYDDY
jgi:hypothetical protein